MPDEVQKIFEAHTIQWYFEALVSDDSKDVVSKILECFKDLFKLFGKPLLTDDGLAELCEDVSALLNGKTLCQENDDDENEDEETEEVSNDLDHDGKVLNSTTDLINVLVET